MSMMVGEVVGVGQLYCTCHSSFNDVFVKLDAAEDAKPGLATIRDVAECCRMLLQGRCDRLWHLCGKKETYNRRHHFPSTARLLDDRHFQPQDSCFSMVFSAFCMLNVCAISSSVQCVHVCVCECVNVSNFFAGIDCSRFVIFGYSSLSFCCMTDGNTNDGT